MAFLNFFGKNKNKVQPLSNEEKLARQWTQGGTAVIELKAVGHMVPAMPDASGYAVFFYHNYSLTAVIAGIADLQHIAPVTAGFLKASEERGFALYMITRRLAELKGIGGLSFYTWNLESYAFKSPYGEALFFCAKSFLGADNTPAARTNRLWFLPVLFFCPMRIKNGVQCFTVLPGEWHWKSSGDSTETFAIKAEVRCNAKTFSYFIAFSVKEESIPFYKEMFLSKLPEAQKVFYAAVLPTAAVTFSTVKGVPAGEQGLVVNNTLLAANGMKTPLTVFMPLESFKIFVSQVLSHDSRMLMPYGSSRAEAVISHLQHQLTAVFYPYMARFYLYGGAASCTERFNPLTDKHIGPPLLAEMLMLLEEPDYKLVLQNFIIPKLGRNLGSALFYRRMVKNKAGNIEPRLLSLTDFDVKAFVAQLPLAIRETLTKNASADYELWRGYNLEVLKELAGLIHNNNLLLSYRAKLLFEEEVLSYFNEKERLMYNSLWEKDFIARWKIAEPKEKIRMIDKLDNRQWAEILAVKPVNFEVLAKYMSSGRGQYLKEEIDYVIQRGIDYKEANSALRTFLKS
jgi:hypothetical protein